MCARMVLMAGALLLVGGRPLLADDSKEAKTTLDSAIVALGGEKVLKAEGSLSGKSKGHVVLNNVKSSVSNEWIVQGTDRVKWTTEVTLNDNPLSVTLGMAGGNLWIRAGNGKANDLSKEYQAPYKQTFAGLRLVENPLLLLDKGVKLAHLGEIKVDDKPAVGIKVTRKGQPEMDLYFDKKTHLPVKAIMRIKDAGSGSEDVEYVGYFSEYKKFGDRLCFTKLKVERDGKVVIDMERSEIKVGEKKDDATFEKP
jgi:hypothetical protein